MLAQRGHDSNVLTTAKCYLQEALHACLSSFGAAVCTDSVQLPGPILLLDEWMDVETSTVVRKVQPSLHKIVEDLNGVVLSITHKPDLYTRDISSMRRVTLSGGKLLSDY